MHDRNELTHKLSEMHVLLPAMDRSLADGRRWLESRIVPKGKVTPRRNFNFFGKPTWGLWSAGASASVINRILDHVAAECVQPSGDLYFDEEPVAVRDGFRLYRVLYCLMVAKAAGHPLARNRQILDRLIQYQSNKTGAVFNFIGDDPRDVRPDPFYAALLTSTCIHLFLQLGMSDRAIRAGKYLVKMVNANRAYMRRGWFHTQADVDGTIITKIPKNKWWCYAVDCRNPKQEFWQIGAIMAALAKLAGHLFQDDLALAVQFGKAALSLVTLEERMSFESYEWPQKCKLAWGGGELLKTLALMGPVNPRIGTSIYRITRNTVVNTFFDAQLPDGGWAGDHYPLCDDAPELDYDYKLLRGFANAPRQPTTSNTCVWFTPEEMSGEFLGELAVARDGVKALVDALEGRKTG